MAFKIKLPGASKRGQGSDQSVVLPRIGRPRLPTLSWQKLKQGLAWGAGLFAVFVVFAWINLPTKAIAWRLSQEAKQAGVILDIGDMSISPLGRVSLYDVTWSFPPERVDETPVPVVIERVDLRVAPLRYLFGRVSATLHAELDEGELSGRFLRTRHETTVTLEVEDLPLYAVPRFQQALNAPVRGNFAMRVELTAPENQFEDAVGTIELTCNDCRMGDGQTKLYVPGAKKGGMLAAGMTVPEIVFGELHSTFGIAEGVATAEEFVSVSDDITIQVAGDIRLHDPFVDSEFGMVIKVFVSEQLQERAQEVRLMVATSGKTQKLRDEDLIEGQSAGLGYKLTGTVKRPKLMGIYAKTRAERLAEARDRRRKAEARRAKAAADRKRKEAERAAAKPAVRARSEQAAEADEGQDEDASPDDAPTLGVAATARVPIIGEAGAGERPPTEESEASDDDNEGDESGDAGEAPDEGAGEGDGADGDGGESGGGEDDAEGGEEASEDSSGTDDDAAVVE